MIAAELIREIAHRFRAARLHYGHGTTNATDEAAWLVGHALGLTPSELPAALHAPVAAARVRKAHAVAGRRIRGRVPLAYLLNEAWIGDHRFHVDRRVIVPRSFIGELIVDGLDAWLPRPPRTALDLCTGSGCLGILLALRYPRCDVDVADISPEALAVARRNIALHRLKGQVHAIRSDVYEGLRARRYDLIIANPPYVKASSMRALPHEYAKEPRLALAGGKDGLDLLRRILAGAATRMSKRGILICEIGHNRKALERAWPRSAFTWIATSGGGDRVFSLERRQTPAAS